MILGALKCRYSCISEPLPPATAGGLDNDPSYSHPLWVFDSRNDEPHTSPAASSFKPMVDLNITVDPQMIKDKIRVALSGLCFSEPGVLVQFWSPVIVQQRCSLTTLDQPFGLGALEQGLYMYRLESEQRTFVIDEEHKEEFGSPGRVYCQKLPEWSLCIHTLPVRQYVHDLAACNSIHGYINLPVFEPDSGCCVGVLELITSSKCIDYAFEVREVLRALKEENLRSSIVFEDHSFYVSCAHTKVRDERRQHELNEIENNTSISAAAEGTGQSVLPCLDVGNEDFNTNPGTTQRNRKKSTSSISLEEIKKHIGKPISVAAASLNVVVSRFMKRFRKSRGILRRPYRNGPDESDSRKRLGQTEIHTSEEASNKVFGERLETKNGIDTLTKHDKHSSTRVLHQNEQTEQYNENTAATNTVKIMTIEATYRDSIARFHFCISEGLAKLEELVAKKFLLDFGSFKLKYVDGDGDLIWIACDSALTESVGDFRQTDHETMIRLLVLPVVHQSPNV